MIQRKLNTSFGKVRATMDALYCRVMQIVPCTIAVLTVIIQDSSRQNDCSILLSQLLTKVTKVRTIFIVEYLEILQLHLYPGGHYMYYVRARGGRTCGQLNIDVT